MTTIMFVLITLLVAGGSMAFAVHHWWRGYHMIAIGSSLLRGLSLGAQSKPQRITRKQKPQKFFTSRSPLDWGEPGRILRAKLLSEDEARRIAANIAKLPGFLQPPRS